VVQASHGVRPRGQFMPHHAESDEVVLVKERSIVHGFRGNIPISSSREDQLVLGQNLS
jgi:hypothetical protein